MAKKTTVKPMYNTGAHPYIAQSSNSKRLFNIIDGCVKAGVPIGFIGNPGVGKTATFEAYAQATGRELINLSLSTLPPEDVSGLPFPTKIEVGEGRNKRTVDAAKYAIPVWQQRLLANPYSILFLDEFSTANPSTQHAFLQLVQNRRLPGSDEPFSREVAIIICMNPAEQAGGSSLDLPIANRFAWFTFDANFFDWKEGYLRGWASEDKMEIPSESHYTDEEITKRQNKFRKIVVDFLDSDKGARQLSIIPKGTETPTSDVVRHDDAAEMERFRLTYPTPRSWENLTNILVNMDDDDNYAVSEVVNGTIGSSRGALFLDYFMRNRKGLDIDVILEDPDSIDWKSMDVDDSAAIFQSLIETAKAGKPLEALNVYLAIKRAGAYNLLSGNRINDIYKSEYTKGLSREERKEFQQKYTEAFSDLLRKTTTTGATAA